jgi:6-phosphogluconolactonase
MPSAARVLVHDDTEGLARAAAELLLEHVRAGRGKLLLAGGTTPARAYQILAGLARSGDYGGLHLFFGDERVVPPDHADSNYGMVRRVWLDPGGVPAECVHRIRGELDADQAARLAEEELRSVAGDPPRLDVALLGMGADGHTASLFPGQDVLAETERLYAPAREGHRITATIPLLAATKHVIFLVSGASKADAVRMALDGPPGAVPASLVQPLERPVTWMLDREAAGRLA